MIQITSPSRIFLSGPLTMFADKKTGHIDQNVVRTLKLMITALRRRGHQVFCAHELEQWGKATKGLTMEQISKRDIAAINSADYVFILPNFGGTYSRGTLDLEFVPLSLRLAALRNSHGTKTIQKINKVMVKPPKGVIYLHHKGVKEDSDFRRIVDGLRGLHPNHFEYLEFSKPSDLVRIVKERAPRVPLTKRILGRARLNLTREVLGRLKLKHHKGSTYFTSKPRRRPI
jgi:hypothetical protein